MTLSAELLQSLSEHWAVSVFSSDELARADRLVNEQLAGRAVDRQTAADDEHQAFLVSEQAAEYMVSRQITEDNEHLLWRVCLAYEVAAIEGLDELGRSPGNENASCNQAIAASYKIFGIWRFMPVPHEAHARVLFVLRLSAAACCGRRWSDLRQWLWANEDAAAVPDAADVDWEHQVLYRVFECWICLFLQQDGNDLGRIQGMVAGLRHDQEKHEERVLQKGSATDRKATALRLVTLYYLAAGIESVASYLLRRESEEMAVGKISKNFEASIKAAVASGDPQREIVVRWLYAAARTMIQNRSVKDN